MKKTNITPPPSKSSYSNSFRLKIYFAFFLLVGVLLVFGAMAFAKYECVPCKANNYCQGGFRYPCPMARPVTKTSGAASEDECFTCIERNGDLTNPKYDILVDDCVSCPEYDSEKPYWNSETLDCSECDNNLVYNSAAKSCCTKEGFCTLNEKVNSCKKGYIAPNSILRNIGIDNANINITSTYGLLAAGILAGNS